VLMDLAMPVIDGWQTIAQMREQELSDAPVAVVSANAFEKGVDNAVGLPSTDFIVKPVRKNELLDWLGQAMRLQWIDAPTRSSTHSAAGVDRSVTPPAASGPTDGQSAPLAPPAWVWPDRGQRMALEQVIALGYLRGIVQQLDSIERAAPATASFVAHMRELARSFQLDAMSGVLRKADHESESH
jgi:chemotaxis response regulator CheB